MNAEQKLGTAAFEEQLRQTTDARVWAQSFMLLTADAEIDEGLMIGWFANAIEWAKIHEQKRLRLAGIDLDHTYADTGINTLNGASMTLGHIERNEPLYVRRPLEDQ